MWQKSYSQTAGQVLQFEHRVLLNGNKKLTIAIVLATVAAVIATYAITIWIDAPSARRESPGNE